MKSLRTGLRILAEFSHVSGELTVTELATRLNMGKSLAQEGMDDLDSKAVAQGIEDAVGKKEQKLKDEELVEAFAALQKRAEERMAKMSEESAAAGKKFLEENGKKPGVTTTASGLQYEVVKKADGPQPKPTDVVTVHYTGKLTNGTVFDSSVERGSPIDLPVSGVIPASFGALTSAPARINSSTTSICIRRTCSLNVELFTESAP